MTSTATRNVSYSWRRTYFLETWSHEEEEEMIEPRILCPERLRRAPAKFSWVDHRLARDNHFHHCQPHAWALYLLLVTVGNAHGVSWYATRTIATMLEMPAEAVAEARAQLVRSDMIAFDPPFYQVLSLDGWRAQEQEERAPPTTKTSLEVIRDIIRRLDETP